MVNKISIVTGVMNRSEILTEGIENWLTYEFVDEIVVVDWNSSIPFEYNHPKVKVYRVEDEPYWIASQAFNLAFLLARNEIVMKLDSDYRVFPEIRNLLSLKKTYFVRGNCDLAIDENDMNLHGFIMVYKDVFFSVNGYNERITTFGYEDEDLYLRLEKKGNVPIHLTPKSGIWHKPHESSLRTVNQRLDVGLSLSNYQNKMNCINHPWTEGDKRTEWNFDGKVYRRKT